MRRDANSHTFLRMSKGLDMGGIRGARGAWWGALSPPRFGGMSVEAYADAMALREAILDEAGVRRRVDVVVGDLPTAWQRLRDHAGRFGMPFLDGDVERSNRVFDWDRMILSDATTQDVWRQVYPRALVRAAGLNADDEIGRAAAAHLEQQPSLLWNAFVPLHMRRPSVTTELRDFARRASTPPPAPSMPPASSGMAPRLSHVDVAVFPGEKHSNLSDFARLQCRIQASDFMNALYKEGLDPISYARLSDRWAKRFAADPALRAEYATALRRESALAAVRVTAPIPHPDTLVFPGQKLARVSDFARISRAAKRGEFKEALERAGVDRDVFANLCARFNEKMKHDRELEEMFKRLLDDPRVDEDGSLDVDVAI
jgi:hypothetical protein